MGDEQGKTVNEAITQLERSVDAELCAKNAVIAELEATVAKAFLALGEVAEVLEPFAKTVEQLDDCGVYAQIADDDDVLSGALKLSLPMVYLRKAKAVRERIMDLCHADPVPGGETSSAEGPHQSTNGETP